MAVALVQSKSAVASSGGAPSAVFTAGPTQNNLLAAVVASAAATACAMTSTGWTALTSVATGTGGSTRALRMFYKVAGAGESSTVTGSAASTAASGIAIAEYSGLKSASPLDVENATSNASGTNTTPSVTPTGTGGGAIVCGIFVRSATTFSAETIGGSGTGVNEREDVNSTNLAVCLFDLLPTSFSGSYSGAATPATNAVECGGIAIFDAPGAAGKELAMVI